MEPIELIRARHSVRQYRKEKVIEAEKREEISRIIESINNESGMHFQVFFDEPQAFSGSMAHYGHFLGVNNYIAVVGKSDYDAGYYGEKLVLEMQRLGLNTCWVVLTYSKGKVKIVKEKGEKLICVISLGYGITNGFPRPSKKPEQITKVIGEPHPQLHLIVEAAIKAPTAMNQQKFQIISNNGEITVKKSGIGTCLDIDLGIVKYHVDYVMQKSE